MKEVLELVRKGRGFLSQIFTVPKKGGEETDYQQEGSKQLLDPPHINMEGLKMVKDLLRKGDFMCKGMPIS